MKWLKPALVFSVLVFFTPSSYAFKEGRCQAYFVYKTEVREYEEALCVQASGVHINLNKNGAYSSSLCGKEWDVTNKAVDLIYVEFRTKRKGSRYRFGVDILRGPEDVNLAKRIAKDRGYIERDGKVQGLIPLNLKSENKNVTGINYDCEISHFDL